MSNRPTVTETRDKQLGEFAYSRRYVDYSRRVKTTTESFANLFSPDGLLEEEITDLITHLEDIKKDPKFESIARNGHGKTLSEFVRQIEFLKRQRDGNELANERQKLELARSDPTRKGLAVQFPCKHFVSVRNIECLPGRGNPTLPLYYAVCTMCGKRHDYSVIIELLQKTIKSTPRSK